jgi:hypothetical protein
MGKGKKSRRHWVNRNGVIVGDNEPSQLVRDMIQMPTACGKHSIFYPAKLALLAMHAGEYHAFHTMCECGTAYIVATQKDGAHTRAIGTPEEIVELYEKIPWQEITIQDGNGVFWCKRAPSYEALLQYFSEN